MNTNTKSGAHPDAEILNAFSEQALNATERGEILSHLAVCQRCRQVVALAQEAGVLEEMPAVAAAAAQWAPAATAPPMAAPTSIENRRAPWWRNTRLAWIPATAMAAALVTAVAIHEKHVGQVAEFNKQAQQNLPQLQNQMAQVEAPARPQVATSAAAPSLANKTKSAPAGQTADIVSRPLAKESGSANSTAGAAPSPPSSNQAEIQSDKKIEVIAGAALATSAPSPQLAPAPTESVQVPAGASASKAAEAAAPNVQAFALRAVKIMPLPSGLEKLSTATRERATVAIDSAGGVFVSEDRGEHWRPVAQQWTGRATRVALSASGSTLELTNDQSEVWVSTDGFTWTAR